MDIPDLSLFPESKRNVNCITAGLQIPLQKPVADESPVSGVLDAHFQGLQSVQRYDPSISRDLH